MERANSARHLVSTGRGPEAIPILADVRSRLAAAVGQDHPHAVATATLLADAYAAAKVRAEAAAAQVVASLERRQFRHRIADALVDRAANYAEEAGDYAAAERWRRDRLAVAAARHTGGEIHAAALHGLAENVIAQQKWADAEPLLLAAHALYGKLPGHDDEVVEVAEQRAEAYTGLGRKKEAAKWRAAAKKAGKK